MIDLLKKILGDANEAETTHAHVRVAKNTKNAAFNNGDGSIDGTD